MALDRATCVNIFYCDLVIEIMGPTSFFYQVKALFLGVLPDEYCIDLSIENGLSIK